MSYSLDDYGAPPPQVGTTPRTQAVDVAVDDSLVLLVMSSATDSDDHGTPQLDGVNMTKAAPTITGTQRCVDLWYKEGVAAGAHTISMAPSSISNRYSWGFMVFSGVAAASAFDGANVGGVSSGTSRTGTITPSVANALTILVNFNLYNAGTNSTLGVGTGDDANAFYNGSDKPASAFSMTATYTSSQQNDYIIAAFKPSAPAKPTVDTLAATDIDEDSATLNGDITDVGAENADLRGFVWDTETHADPGDVAPASSDYASNSSESGDFGAGTFAYALTSLAPSTTYYVRAWAHNGEGYAYGDEISFSTDEPPPFRFTNLPGVVFDESDTTTIYAERLNDILERLEALEG